MSEALPLPPTTDLSLRRSAETKEKGTFVAIARAIIRRAILRFRRKTYIIRHMRRRHAFGIVRPCLRQIKRTVDKKAWPWRDT